MWQLRWAYWGLAGWLAACGLSEEATPFELGDNSRFVEVDAVHSTATFRRYIDRAITMLRNDDHELARLTAAALDAGYVQVDEFADLTCADFMRVRTDLPDAGIAATDFTKLGQPGHRAVGTIEAQLAGYQWSHRIYLARGMTTRRLAATLIHEVNHVINRSEVGYYDDLPTSAFLHEYRAFYAEAQFDPDEYTHTNLVDHVLDVNGYDRQKVAPAVLAEPLTPILLADEAAWQQRAPWHDVETSTASCP